MEGEDRLMAMHRKVHATRAQQTEVEYIMELQGLDRIQGMCRVLDTEDAQVVGGEHQQPLSCISCPP